MEKLKKRILHQLAANVGLASAHELATALMEDVDDVRNVLTALVRQKKVKRHHESYGELLYSMLAEGPGSDVRPLPDAKLSLTERIRSILAHANEPMTAKQVAEALPQESEAAVRGALYNAVHRKEAVSHEVPGRRGKAYALAEADTAKATVTATATATATARADTPTSAGGAEEGVASPPSDKAGHEVSSGDLGGLLNENVFMAEWAMDKYMRAHLDMDVYDSLVRSRDAARKARDAFLAMGTA